jgi:hypothetical protein
MPSVSQAQSRLMAAAAHTKGGYGGVPRSVGKDFNNADTGKKRSALPNRVTKLRKRGMISDRQHEKMESRGKEASERR